MAEDRKSKPIEILLVDDNPGDVRLTEEALKETKVNSILNVVVDGVEALHYLRRTGKYTNAARPEIMLLDLNLPRKDGREVLEEIKNDVQLKGIPVIVLSTSNAEQDVIKAYQYHANCYITKPDNFNQFVKIIESTIDYWFNIVRLPQKEQNG
ncbi:MAG: response regulator [Candidatus Anammoxibacter sp.]